MYVEGSHLNMQGLVTVVHLLYPIARLLEMDSSNILKFYHIQDTARCILEGTAGLVVVDDRDSNCFPTPLDVSFPRSTAFTNVSCYIKKARSIFPVCTCHLKYFE